MAGKKHVIELSLRKPAKNSRAMREINRLIADERESLLRKRCIQAAQYVRDAVADNAPKPIFKQVLQSEKLERFYNKNPGYDLKMEAGARMTFVLELSTNRFSLSQFKGWNPVWGILVSNYGRGEINVQKPSAIPIPTMSVTKRLYEHPRFGYGYGNMYNGMYVKFTQHVDAVVGTHWIEDGVRTSYGKVGRILSGKEKYTPAGLVRGALAAKF